MKTVTPWRARRVALSSILVGTMLLAGMASPAVASVPATTPVPPAPAPQITRHLDPGSNVTTSALANRQSTHRAPGSTPGTHIAATDGSIHGSVEDSRGFRVSGVIVSVYSAEWDGATPYEYTLTLAGTVTTDPDGHYQIGVSAGYYKLFFDPVDDPDLAWMWDSGEAYPGAVATSVTTTGWQANVTLPAAHAVSGTLTGGPSSTSLTGAPLTLWAGENRSDGQLWFTPVWDLSSQSGGYDFSQVPDGEYLVEVKAPDARYAGEWWNNKPDFASSDIIELFSGDATANVNLAQYAQVLPALTVTGTAAVGKSVSVAVPTKVSGATYFYYWYADGVYITGSSGKTSITLASAQADKRITARVKVAKPGYVTVARSTAATTRVIASSAPTIAGALAVGRTLTAKPNAWTTGTTFTYQWYANGAVIPGATASTYTLTLAERDKTMKVGVKGSKPGYTTYFRGSAATAMIAQIAQPKISGTPKVGQKLVVKTAGWTPGTTFKYQWYSGGTVISGVVSSSLTVVSAYVGKVISVRVIGSKTGYVSFAQYSPPTAAVVR